MPPHTFKRPMLPRTRSWAIAKPRDIWDVRLWPWRCVATRSEPKLASRTSKSFPNGTLWNAVRLPEIRAALALSRDEPAKSVELLASALPYERSCPDAAYFRGLAYLRMHRGAEAAAEFQKVIAHKGSSWYLR